MSDLTDSTSSVGASSVGASSVRSFASSTSPRTPAARPSRPDASSPVGGHDVDRVAARREPSGPEDHHPWRVLAHRWPLQWRDLGAFGLAWVVLTALFTGIGELVVGPLDGSVGRTDRDLAEQFANDRTARLDDVSYWGSMLAETGVKIAVTAVVIAVMIAVWKRWEDSLLVASALILEACVFITVTFLVGRQRPDVPRLDSSPVDSSFPSGHVAAAVVYGAFAIIVARHARRRWPVVVAVSVCVLVSLAVAWARMYRGMHHLSDVIAGVVLGLMSLAATWWIIRRAEERSSAAGTSSRRDRPEWAP